MHTEKINARLAFKPMRATLKNIIFLQLAHLTAEKKSKAQLAELAAAGSRLPFIFAN